MIGVFDSGRGGALAVSCLHQKLPRADIAFFGDTENAPYGTKTEAELLPLLACDIRRLFGFGAEHILCACCTASRLHDRLPLAYRKICFPIIRATVNLALQKTTNKRIGVLATEATVRSHVFRDTLRLADKNVEVSEIAAQELVFLAELYRTDPKDEGVKTACRRAVTAFAGFSMDTLILGCTHFPLFSSCLSEFFPNVTLVSSVEAGIVAFIETLPEEEKCGQGRLFSLS